jgi:flagellar hook assembly protein FlgD
MGWRVLSYVISDSPASATIKIADSKGNVVRQINATTNNDTYDLAWDGKNDAGVALPNDIYTLTVTTTNAKAPAKIFPPPCLTPLTA